MSFLKKYKEYIIYPLLFLVSLIRVIHISFPFGDYDEGVYTATTRSLLHGFPLFTSTYSSQFPLLFYIAEPLYALSHSLIILRFIPITLSIAACIGIYVVVKKYTNIYLALFACAYLGFNSIFLLVSRTFQLDVPWVSTTLLSFVCLLLFDRTRKQYALILSAIFFITALLIKANPLFLPVLAVYAIYLIKEDYIKGVQYVVEYVFISLVVLLLVIHPNELSLLYHQAISIRQASVGFHPVYTVLKQLVIHEFPILLLDVYAFFILLKEKITRHNRFFILSFTWLAATSIAFLFYTELFPHHLVFLIIPSLLVAVFALNYLWHTIEIQSIQYLFIGILICIVIYTTVTSPMITGILFSTDSIYDTTLLHIASYVDTHSNNRDYVVSDDQLVLYLADRNTTPDLVDTSHVRIQQHSLSTTEVLSQLKTYNVKLVIMVSGRLTQLPGLTLALQHDYHMVTIDNSTIFIKR